ncbi:hypothetical protein [Streptomyces sp. NPDC006879]|uniref:hypothetical protein n=1 Tax=Streptomyces sp. NPDC006879 TaxID=3364767 RepID=UPI0036C38445
MGTVTDRISGRRFAEVRDAAVGHGGGARGWGRIYLDLDAHPRWSVQVPHPVADEDTERLGVRILRASPGGVMVLAGAHRAAGRGNAADMAHRTDTVFHAVIKELMGRGLPGIQVHGFANSSVPMYDAVASTGEGEVAVKEGRRLAKELRANGLAVCSAWARPCKLAGRENKQGTVAADHDLPFLHLELSREVRLDQERQDEVAKAVSAVTRHWSSLPEGTARLPSVAQ